MGSRCMIGRYAQLSSIFLLAGLAALLLIYPIVRLPLWLENPNEGWNAIHAMHAFGPQLYPSRDGFIINNYPPLWFYLTGALAKIFGDLIFPGRVLAFLAFNFTAVAIFAALRALNATVIAACIGALTFIVILAGLFRIYVGLSEPQMMAHAFCTSGVALALGAKTRSRVMVGAAMVVTGLLFKHTVVGLPVALTVWMFQNRRPFFSTWLSTTVLLGVAAGAMIMGVYGRNFIDNFMFPRVLMWSRLGTNLALLSKVVVPLGVYIAVAWRLRRRHDSGMAFAGYAILSGVAALVVFRERGRSEHKQRIRPGDRLRHWSRDRMGPYRNDDDRRRPNLADRAGFRRWSPECCWGHPAIHSRSFTMPRSNSAFMNNPVQ